MIASEDGLAPLVAQWEPAVTDSFLRAVKDIRDQVVLARLEAEIRNGDVEAALQEVGLGPERFHPLDAALTAAFVAGAATTLLTVNRVRKSGAPVAFNVRAYSVDAWVRENNGRLISDVANDQRAMARSVLVQAVRDRASPRETALDLIGRRHTATGRREAGLVGLSSAQLTWVRNYEADLEGVPKASALTRSLREPRFDRVVRAAIEAKAPLPAATRKAMVGAYRNRALRQRVIQIAEMEASKVLHQAQIAAAGQAIAAGVIDATQVRRFWVHMNDSRVRPTHRLIPALNKDGVGIDEMFLTPDGPTLYPPFGMGCRCRVRIGVSAKTARLAA